ncbi:MAG: hypothetical protein C0407_10035 [Desulfobacca sp.]|nr:hypothetical protein [Desulfobacca sp.]
MKNGIKHILVVDDEPAVLLALKKILSNAKLRIETADTFQGAMDLITKNNFVAIIADLRLTGILGEEGLDILRFVKKEQPETKFILITGYGTPEVKERALTGGADYYFEKPVSPYTIQEALDELGVGLDVRL